MTNSSQRLASIRSLGDSDFGVWVPFEDRAQAKGLPGARWDKHLKCWRVNRMFAREAEAVVEALNGGVDARLVDATRTVLGSVRPALRVEVYRAMVRVLHPDRGGDPNVMKALTAAWAELAQ